MNNTINLENTIEKLQKTSSYLVSGSVFCMFSYVILLGLTSANVVTLRSTTKSVEDSKTQLSTVELSYMTDANMMALESKQTQGFKEADNISYVNVNSVENMNTVAIADGIK